MKVAQLLGSWGSFWHHECRDRDCLSHRSYGPVRVFFLKSQGFLGGSAGKEFTCNSGEGNGNPLQYSRLENPMDRGVWQATVRGVAKNWTRLSD